MGIGILVVQVAAALGLIACMIGAFFDMGMNGARLALFTPKLLAVGFACGLFIEITAR